MMIGQLQRTSIPSQVGYRSCHFALLCRVGNAVHQSDESHGILQLKDSLGSGPIGYTTWTVPAAKSRRFDQLVCFRTLSQGSALPLSQLDKCGSQIGTQWHSTSSAPHADLNGKSSLSEASDRPSKPLRTRTSPWRWLWLHL